METVCPGGSNWLGTICPWGPNFWGPFVLGDRKWGTGSPGIKWVRDQMSRSPKYHSVIQLFLIFAILGVKLASLPKSNSRLRVPPRRGRVVSSPLFPVSASSPFPRVSIPPSSPSPSLATSYDIPFCDAIVAIFGAKLASQTISIVVSFSASFLLKIARQ